MPTVQSVRRTREATSVAPTDNELYEKIKKEIYLKYSQHSAYRSGILYLLS